MDGGNAGGDIPDMFAASPFSEPYPLSRQEIVAVQPSVPWTDNLDYILSGLVRKYVFDFNRVSRSLRKYVEVILCEIDDERLDPNHYSEEACRLRWSFLDFEEFERRKLVAQELFTMRTLLAPRLQKSIPSPVSDQQKFQAVMAVECDVFTMKKTTAEETEQGNQPLDSRSHGTECSFTRDIFVDDKSKSSQPPHSSDSMPPTLRPVNSLSCKSELSKDSSQHETDKSSKLATAVSSIHQNFPVTAEESDLVARPFDDQIEPTPTPAQTQPNKKVSSPQNIPRQL
jgi:hypothetical protein